MRTHKLGERLGRKITGARAEEMRGLAELYTDPDFKLTTRTTCDLGNIILDLLDASNEESVDEDLNFMYSHLINDQEVSS